MPKKMRNSKKIRRKLGKSKRLSNKSNKSNKSRKVKRKSRKLLKGGTKTIIQIIIELLKEKRMEISHVAPSLPLTNQKNFKIINPLIRFLEENNDNKDLIVHTLNVLKSYITDYVSRESITLLIDIINDSNETMSIDNDLEQERLIKQLISQLININISKSNLNKFVEHLNVLDFVHINNIDIPEQLPTSPPKSLYSLAKNAYRYLVKKKVRKGANASSSSSVANARSSSSVANASGGPSHSQISRPISLNDKFIGEIIDIYEKYRTARPYSLPFYKEDDMTPPAIIERDELNKMKLFIFKLDNNALNSVRYSDHLSEYRYLILTLLLTKLKGLKPPKTDLYVNSAHSGTGLYIPPPHPSVLLPFGTTWNVEAEYEKSITHLQRLVRGKSPTEIIKIPSSIWFGFGLTITKEIRRKKSCIDYILKSKLEKYFPIRDDFTPEQRKVSVNKLVKLFQSDSCSGGGGDGYTELTNLAKYLTKSVELKLPNVPTELGGQRTIERAAATAKSKTTAAKSKTTATATAPALVPSSYRK
jgi:hypothetical protein